MFINILFSFSLLFLLSCKFTTNPGVLPEGTTKDVGNSVDENKPPIPTLALKSPATTPGSDSTPTIEVSNLVSGLTVKLYTDACITQTGLTGTSTGTTLDIDTSVLSDGVYTLYANTADSSGASDCSAVLNYTKYTPPPTPTIALQSPTASPSVDTTPTIRVSNLVSGLTVKLYTDACSTQTGSSGTSTGTTLDIDTSALADGSYTFYANVTDASGFPSACSAVLNYRVFASAMQDLNDEWAVQTNITEILTGFLGPATTVTGLNLIMNTANLQTWRLSRALTAPELLTVDSLINSIAAQYDAELVSSIATEQVTNYRNNDLNFIAHCSPAKASGYIMPGFNGTTYKLIQYQTSPSRWEVRINADNSLVIQNLQDFNSACRYITSDQAAKQYVDMYLATKIELDFPMKIKPTGGNPGGFGRVQSLHGTMLTDFCNRQFYATDGQDSTLLCPPKPTSLTLVSPAVASGTDTTPTLRVGGIISGVTVRLFKDSLCSIQTGTDATSTGTTLDMDTSPLAVGAHTIYANTYTPTYGYSSACSAVRNYQVLP